MSLIITLSSDWNKNDYYVGIVKAKLLTEIPNVNVIDISHNITHFNVTHSGFLLKHIYKNYPENTINIICVDTVIHKNKDKNKEENEEEDDEDKNYYAVKANNRYFISANNGVFGLILEVDEIQAVYEFPCLQKDVNFPENEIFTAIAKLITEGNLAEFEVSSDKIKLTPLHQPTKMSNMLNGNVIYIDSYGNAITNITKELFYQNVHYGFEIIIETPTTKITKISNNYNDVECGELVAIFNSLGLLEIAQRNNNFCKLYAVDESTRINISFGKSLF